MSYCFLSFLVIVFTILSYSVVLSQNSILSDSLFEAHINRRNTWAVIIDTSRYFYNYRHASNALSFYRTIKRLGIPDNQIILMLADDVACNARNAEPGRLVNDRHTRLDLYGEDVEVDFRGEEVTVDNFRRLLTGRQLPWTPLSKRLLTDSDSHVFIFMTGHGGNRFLRFQDWEEISSQDISDALHQMNKQERYRRILFLVDSCQSETMHDAFKSPNIVAAGCSKKGQNSYSHHDDQDIGVAVIDRFTYNSLHFLEGITPESNATLQEFFDSLDPSLLLSDPGIRTDLSDKPLSDLLISSFFSASGTGAEVRFVGDDDSSITEQCFPMSFANSLL